MKYLFLITILTCSLFGCSDGEEYDRSSPEDTVRSYLEAIEDEDFERMIACVDGFDNIPDNQLQREQMEKTFGNITTKISDIKIAPILKNDNFALLEVSYENDIKYEENSKSIEVQEKIEHTAELVKISSTWLIQFIGDSEGWENILFLVVVAVIWGVGGIIKSRAEQAQRKKQMDVSRRQAQTRQAASGNKTEIKKSDELLEKALRFKEAVAARQIRRAESRQTQVKRPVPKKISQTRPIEQKPKHVPVPPVPKQKKSVEFDELAKIDPKIQDLPDRFGRGG